MWWLVAERLFLWRGLDSWRAEAVRVTLTSDGVRARGTQIGEEYWLEYELDAGNGFVTRSLELQARGEGWTRTLSLTHDGAGAWQCKPGDAAAVAGALDCDLGFSPLTNLMPIRRHNLHRLSGAAEILAAWVSVPELTLHASRQRYEHVRVDGDSAVVRYIDLGAHHGFTSELVVDRDGVVVVYPELAQRV